MMPEIAAGLTESRHQRSLSSTCRRDGIVGFDILKCVEPLTETAFEESQGRNGGSNAGGHADGEAGDRAAASTAAE